jgi:hypothetical protein
MSEAIDVFHEGLRIDPTSAPYPTVSISPNNGGGGSMNAERALALVQKIDPEFVRMQRAK